MELRDKLYAPTASFVKNNSPDPWKARLFRPEIRSEFFWKR